MSRYRARFYDPTGVKHGGLPTWPWRMAPAQLATRRQLTARGLRPGGQPIAGQVLWMGQRRRVRVAYLYDVGLAKPKRHATPRQKVALGKAMTARRTCPTCGEDVGYCIPRSLGECAECHDARGRTHSRAGSMNATLRCLDCAALLYTSGSGRLVDQWGERICSASCRPHAADLPNLSVLFAGPAAPAGSMPDRLRRAVPLAGAGAVPDLPPHPKPAAQHPSRTAPLDSATPGSILRSGFARGPSGPVPGAPRAGAQPTPARPQTGPATTGGAS